MSNLNILIVPSWYPTPRQQLRGSFFQEQAQFLQGKEGLDFQVLYGEKKSFTLLRWVWIFIQSLFKPTWPISTKKVQQGPLAYGFDFPANRRITDNLQIQLEKRLFLKAYRTFVLQGWKPDLIHAQSGMDAGIYAHDLSKIHNIPFVIIEHQVFVFHYYSRVRAKMVLRAFEAANKTASVSEDERRQVLMNQPNCNPKVIWNLVDETRYQIQLEKRNKVFTIITILNSLPIKGFDTFLEAMFELVKETQNFKFIMIGKGADEKSKDPASNAFVRKSKELGIYSIGEFIPFVERDQISNILNTSHVFVSPTIQEPHGIAIREAMMCGIPVVTTANGGVEDSINQDTGLIVPVKSPQKLAAAILKIKNSEIKFIPQRIRDLAISQSGTKMFLKKMKEFYNFPE
ncbi:MAG: glycosyltransferase [Cyclobacteriaceae bacterium]